MPEVIDTGLCVGGPYDGQRRTIPDLYQGDPMEAFRYAADAEGNLVEPASPQQHGVVERRYVRDYVDGIYYTYCYYREESVTPDDAVAMLLDSYYPAATGGGTLHQARAECAQQLCRDVGLRELKYLANQKTLGEVIARHDKMSSLLDKLGFDEIDIETERIDEQK